jgi:hypothetical protein
MIGVFQSACATVHGRTQCRQRWLARGEGSRRSVSELARLNVAPALRSSPPIPMPTDSIVYTINLLIGLILALVLTPYWRVDASAFNLRLWIVAAWVLAGADLLFALRPGMPYWMARFFPTLAVTVGHAVLLLAAQRTAGVTLRPRVLVGVVAAHGAALAFFLATDSESSWRTVTNGVVWGALSVLAAAALWRASKPVQTLLRVTAAVFLAQGVFHAARTLMALQLLSEQASYGNEFVQLVGDLEVSLFIVALFVSVLVAYLRLGNLELRAALDDVQQLSGMLPLCAWCHKVRDDHGYWTKIEQYLQERRVTVTHSICESCAEEFDPAAGPPEVPVVRRG